MAENKKSFLFYVDWKEIFNELELDKKGELIDYILKYVSDENPVNLEGVLKMALIPIKAQLKRDLKKWQLFVDKQSFNGAKGGRPKTQETQAFFKKPKKAVTDTVTDTVTVNVKVNDTVKENIDSRKLKFASTLEPFKDVYGISMVGEFFEYWTEPNKSNIKFRQELEKTWSLERRLQTWARNDKGFKKTKTETKQPDYDQLAKELENL